jgi:WD40 repeat protein
VLPSLLAITLTFASGAVPAHAVGGTELWTARYVTPDSFNGVSGIEVSPDGSRVFMTGFIGRFEGDDYRTVAYDASNGAQLWTKRYNGTGDGRDLATALGVSPDGSTVFVTGWSMGTTTWVDYATIAYDASTGDRLWVNRYSNPVHGSSDVASALAVSPDGSSVFVTGTSDGGTSLKDVATLAYDASTGERIWLSRYDGGSWDTSRALSVSPDGSMLFVSGYEVSSGTSLDFLTVGYDPATGAQRWRARYDGHRSIEDQVNASAVSPDGRTLFVTGFSEGSNGKRDFATVAYRAATGAQRWVRRYNGPVDWNDNAKAIAVSPDGSRVFVTGYRTGHEARDAETIAYDASTGERLWLRRYDGGADNDDQATAIGVSLDGRSVIITGFRRAPTFDKDYVTVAYRAASGARRWLRPFDDAGSYDVASALAVDPVGASVFVSGVSDADFVTIAYGTS